MKIICFNINGIRARIPQLTALVEKHQPDIIGLQETKVHDDAFPLKDLQHLGYEIEYFGQKSHYGVALLSKQKASNVQKGFVTDEEDSQKRFISAEYQMPDGHTLTVMNGYFPQGENIAHETKYPAKRKFYADLMSHLESDYAPENPLVVMGDLNISPQDIDIGIGEANRKRWLKTGKTSFQPEEREWLGKLLNWGLHDSFRVLHPNVDDQFSWFDYRSRAFEADPKRGLRIDAILVSNPLRSRCVDAGIDYELRGLAKPSDHAPIWLTLS